MGRLGVFLSAIYFAQFEAVEASQIYKPALVVNMIALLSLICAFFAFKYDREID